MKDILFGASYELEIENGDFKIGDSEAQNIQLLMDTQKGDWSQSPLTGIGLVRWKNGRLDARLEREIILQLTADGLTDLKVNIEGKQINIDRK